MLRLRLNLAACTECYRSPCDSRLPGDGETGTEEVGGSGCRVGMGWSSRSVEENHRGGIEKQNMENGLNGWPSDMSSDNVEAS